MSFLLRGSLGSVSYHFSPERIRMNRPETPTTPSLLGRLISALTLLNLTFNLSHQPPAAAALPDKDGPEEQSPESSDATILDSKFSPASASAPSSTNGTRDRSFHVVDIGDASFVSCSESSSKPCHQTAAASPKSTLQSDSGTGFPPQRPASDSNFSSTAPASSFDVLENILLSSPFTYLSSINNRSSTKVSSSWKVPSPSSPSKPIHNPTIPNTHSQISCASQEESDNMRAETSGSRDPSFHVMDVGDASFPSCLSSSSSSAVSSSSFSSKDSFPASSTPAPTTQNSQPKAEMSTEVNNPGGLHLMSSGTSNPLLLSSSEVSSREEGSALSSFSSATPLNQDSQPSVPFHLSLQSPLSSTIPSQQGPVTSLQNSQPDTETTRTDPDSLHAVEIPRQWGRVLLVVATSTIIGVAFTARHLTTAVICVVVIADCISIPCILIVDNLLPKIPGKTMPFLVTFGQSMAMLGFSALSFDLLPRYFKIVPVLFWVGSSIAVYFGVTSEREGEGA